MLQMSTLVVSVTKNIMSPYHIRFLGGLRSFAWQIAPPSQVSGAVYHCYNARGAQGGGRFRSSTDKGLQIFGAKNALVVTSAETLKPFHRN